MDPVTGLAIGSSLAGFGSGFFAPEGQQLEGFSGQRTVNDPFTGQGRTVRLDPAGTLAEALGANRSMFDQFVKRAGQPVTQQNTLPSAFVQQPATFSGGGLPMDIGVTAFDHANPFFTPTAPPGGFSGAAQALLSGFQQGQGGQNFPGLQDQTGGFGIDDSQEFEPPRESPGSREDGQNGFTFNQFSDPRPPQFIRDMPALQPDFPGSLFGEGGQQGDGGTGQGFAPPGFGGPPSFTDSFMQGDPRVPDGSVRTFETTDSRSQMLDSLRQLGFDPKMLLRGV